MTGNLNVPSSLVVATDAMGCGFTWRSGFLRSCYPGCYPCVLVVGSSLGKLFVFLDGCAGTDPGPSRLKSDAPSEQRPRRFAHGPRTGIGLSRPRPMQAGFSR